MVRYRGFELRSHTSNRSHIRVYDHCGEFKQTSNAVKDAKRLIDFCLRYKLWKLTKCMMCRSVDA